MRRFHLKSSTSDGFSASRIGLAAAGCPKDEYEPEVSTIIPRLKVQGLVGEATRPVGSSP